MARSYYGDKLSPNMTETPEGFLICQNVNIGRIGYMEYYGHELPAALGFKPDQIVKVYRKPEELFSEATMGSFEGKPITNRHPSDNLDIGTVTYIQGGHAQNIRREGEFLLADLVITDAGLKDDILSDRKREVSCGYDCLWVPMEDGTVEQREIVGNHVAVVENGRAGARVSIKDQKPDERSKKMKKGITKDFLAALGFKHFAQDAEPEEIAEAMGAMKDAEASEVKEPEKVPAKDEETSGNEEVTSLKGEIDGLKTQIADLISTVKSLVQSDKEAHEEFNAEKAMDALEGELEGKEEESKEEAKDEEPETKEEEKKEEGAAADSAPLMKFVQDMKPVIMAIPDEKARNEAAKLFVSAVQDSRKVVKNGYADILQAVSANKKAAMDEAAHKRETSEQRATKGADAWNQAGAKMKGGNN